MRIHLLGICGTFMAGLAYLARALGHEVSGSDEHIYPPMSEFLAAAQIPVVTGYAAENLDPRPDLVIIGNALSRGNDAVEAVLASGLPYTSGPQWLAENVLYHRHVIAVAGTHGKTTTTSILAWILEAQGYDPGFLIGGIANNFDVPARLGSDPYFVIEADEYDTAFFDKRAKFMHYRPRTLVITNIEFDHADIFDDLEAIKRQFHYLLRTVPPSGMLVFNFDDEVIAEVLTRGIWSERLAFGTTAESDWRLLSTPTASTDFAFAGGGAPAQTLVYALPGQHNALNALGACAAASHLGIGLADSTRALQQFAGIKRRLELLANVGGTRVYDDFAHHPTAISASLRGLRSTLTSQERIVAVLEPRSNTMRRGVHQHSLAQALDPADEILLYAPPDLSWDPRAATAALGAKCSVSNDLDALCTKLVTSARTGDHIVFMSNGGFGGIHQKTIAALQQRAQESPS